MSEQRRPARALVGCMVLTLAASVVALAGTVAGAVAVGESCHGQPATFVGRAGSEIRGTDGADVVVTNGAARTFTGAGDDLVCVTGGSGLGYADVQVSDGDDVVDTSANQADAASAILGHGDDTFVGGSKPDFVTAADRFDSPRAQGTDTVSTAGGADFVVTGGSLSHPDDDTIDLGPGRDDVSLEGAVDPALPLLGGAGADQLELNQTTLRHALVIDNATGRATDGGVTAIAWSGIESFDLSPVGPWSPPSFIGGAGAERLRSLIPLTSVDLGGGDDLVNLELQGRVLDHASYVGGAGNDAFILYSGPGDQARRVRLDIPAGRLFFRRDQQAMHARIHAFERERFSAWRLDVRGSAAADHVQWLGCRGEVDGGPGDDLIEAMSDGDAGCGYDGEDAELVVRGGHGDDTLVGNYFPDVLLGGSGHDLADGRGNSDRCVAETTTHCERVPSRAIPSP